MEYANHKQNAALHAEALAIFRDGKPTEPPTKGSTFKGPFHLPRALVLLDVILGEVLQAAQ